MYSVSPQQKELFQKYSFLLYHFPEKLRFPFIIYAHPPADNYIQQLNHHTKTP
jgi:hypothetical protein